MTRHSRVPSLHCQLLFLYRLVRFFFCIALNCANIHAGISLFKFIFSNRGLYALSFLVSESP